MIKFKLLWRENYSVFTLFCNTTHFGNRKWTSIPTNFRIQATLRAECSFTGTTSGQEERRLCRLQRKYRISAVFFSSLAHRGGKRRLCLQGKFKRKQVWSLASKLISKFQCLRWTVELCPNKLLKRHFKCEVKWQVMHCNVLSNCCNWLCATRQWAMLQLTTHFFLKSGFHKPVKQKLHVVY